MNRSVPGNIRHEAGVTMIEVLVVLVIVAIGLLGVAALQLNNLRYSSMSSGRQQAALVAEQLADRIRANAAADYSRHPVLIAAIVILPPPIVRPPRHQSCGIRSGRDAGDCRQQWPEQPGGGGQQGVQWRWCSVIR
jgi:prepilin-type N-terminal cleavage/methylation domain-containing protein